MNKYFTSTFSVINLYKRPSTKSEIVTQMIYGDSFSISKKKNKWLKIKIKEDNYKGYIIKKKFSSYLIPTHKLIKLKSNIYKFPRIEKKNIYALSFGSKITATSKKAGFIKFKRGWISANNVKPIKYKEKDIFKKIRIFKNVKYKWGGKSYKGIDCSGLVQIFLNFNNIFSPRDANDQYKYFKRNINLKKIRKNDILYWKGHVAIALSKNLLIHAYGPLKKTVIMKIKDTLKKIKETANLDLKRIKRII